jgi:hypothetical protein
LHLGEQTRDSFLGQPVRLADLGVLPVQLLHHLLGVGVQDQALQQNAVQLLLLVFLTALVVYTYQRWVNFST